MSGLHAALTALLSTAPTGELAHTQPWFTPGDIERLLAEHPDVAAFDVQHGQPVPEPAPAITVGCIVRVSSDEDETMWEYRGEHDGLIVLRGPTGPPFIANRTTTADLTYVAASRAAHGWPAIEGS